jgi:HPt (histidine-containing phosphotransfer) domain-containing protein
VTRLNWLRGALGAQGTGAVSQLVEIFLDTVPAQLVSIEEAAAAGDAERVRWNAHRLRGTCLQFGAGAAAAQCLLIERFESSPELPALLDELRRCVEATLGEIGRYGAAAG